MKRVCIDGARRIVGGGGRGPRAIRGLPLPMWFGLPSRSPANTLVELPDGRRVVVPRLRWRFLRRKA